LNALEGIELKPLQTMLNSGTSFARVQIMQQILFLVDELMCVLKEQRNISKSPRACCGVLKLLGCIGWKRHDIVWRIQSLVTCKDDAVRCFAMVALIRLEQWDESLLSSLLQYQGHKEESVRTEVARGVLLLARYN